MDEKIPFKSTKPEDKNINKDTDDEDIDSDTDDGTNEKPKGDSDVKRHAMKSNGPKSDPAINTKIQLSNEIKELDNDSTATSFLEVGGADVDNPSLDSCQNVLSILYHYFDLIKKPYNEFNEQHIFRFKDQKTTPSCS